MSEVVSIHVGGAGCRLGQAFWTEVLREHAMDPDGGRGPDPRGPGAEATERFFGDNGARWVPRAVFVDLDPAAHRALLTAHPRTFHPEQLVWGDADTGGNHARGKNAHAKGVVDGAMDRVRRQVERCRELQGFIVTCGIGGGAGSGLVRLVLEGLGRDYPGELVTVFALLPARDRVDHAPITAPYNAVLAVKHLADHADLVFPIENQRLHERAGSTLSATPAWAALNEPVVRAMLEVTASMRKEVAPRYDLAALKQALVSGVDQKLRPPAEAVRLVAGDTRGTENITTVVGAWLAELGRDFDALFAKKAYVHHYVREGVTEAELVEARARVDQLRRAYQA